MPAGLTIKQAPRKSETPPWTTPSTGTPAIKPTFGSRVSSGPAARWAEERTLTRSAARQISDSSINFGETVRNYRLTDWNWFIADDWKVSPSLTLNPRTGRRERQPERGIVGDQVGVPQPGIVILGRVTGDVGIFVENKDFASFTLA